MTGKGHSLVGIGVGLALLGACPALLPHGVSLLSFAGALAGSTAPDWLEFPQRPSFWGGAGTRLIPHRTITHWWPLWVATVLYALHLQNPLVSPWLLGFGAGGLSHLLVDLPNPMGVPVWLPFARSRKSLRWWRSGEHEFLIVAVFFIVGLHFFSPTTLPFFP